MEFFMTYGWAILIIAVVLAALFELGIFNHGFGASTCIPIPGFTCRNPVYSANTITFDLGQNTGHDYYGNWVFVASQGEPLSANGIPINFTLGTPPLYAAQIGSGPDHVLIPGQITNVTFSYFPQGEIPPGTPAGTDFAGYVWLGYCTSAPCAAPTNYEKVATMTLVSVGGAAFQGGAPTGSGGGGGVGTGANVIFTTNLDPINVMINGVSYQTPYVLHLSGSNTYRYSFLNSANGYPFSQINDGCTYGVIKTNYSSISADQASSNCTIEAVYGVPGVSVTFGTDVTGQPDGTVLTLTYNGNTINIDGATPVTISTGSNVISYDYTQNITSGGYTWNFSYVTGCGITATSPSGNLGPLSSPCGFTAYYNRTGAGSGSGGGIGGGGGSGGSVGTISNLVVFDSYENASGSQINNDVGSCGLGPTYKGLTSSRINSVHPGVNAQSDTPLGCISSYSTGVSSNQTNYAYNHAVLTLNYMYYDYNFSGAQGSRECPQSWGGISQPSYWITGTNYCDTSFIVGSITSNSFVPDYGPFQDTQIPYIDGPYPNAFTYGKAVSLGVFNGGRDNMSLAVYYSSSKPLSSPVAYVQIAITNKQNVNTAAPFQQEISFSASTYSQYERGNLGNIRFYLGAPNTGQELYSWCGGYGESGCLNSSSNSEFWVKIPGGIPAQGTVYVNMTFENKSVNYDGIFAGENPTATEQTLCQPGWSGYAGTCYNMTTAPYQEPGTEINYGEFDNGAKVFSYYDNFASLAGWTSGHSSNAMVSVSDGVSLSTNDTTGANWAGIESNSGLSSSQQIFETFIVSMVGVSGSDAGLGMATTPHDMSSPMYFWGINDVNNACGFGQGNFTKGVGLSCGNAVPSAGTSGIIWLDQSIEQTFGGMNGNTYSAGTSTWNLNSLSMPSYYYPTIGLPYNGQSCYWGPGYTWCITNYGISVQWARARAYPPNGAMPQTSFSQVHAP